MLKTPRNMTWLESGPEFCTRPPPNILQLTSCGRKNALAPRDNLEPRHTACMCASLYVCARTDQTTVAKLHRLLKCEANKHLIGQARSEHIRPHSRADCPKIVTRCDTCATPGCAARIVYASGRLPRGCALLVARLAAPHSENAPQISDPYPIVEQI